MPPFFMNLCKVQGFFCRLNLHLKIVLGSKRVIFRRGTPALYRPLVFPSYDLPIPRQALTFVEFIFAFSLYEMSLDISNPCGNILGN